jgi:SOS-response transcriptional repressor LexA
MRMETLGSRIKHARSLRRGLTQAAVAKHFGIERVSVTQWESDTTRPDPEKIPSLAKLLGTSTDWLITGQGKAPASIVGSYDPDAPTDDLADDRADDTPRAEPHGDVANLDIRAGLGLGSPQGVETDADGHIYADHVAGFWNFPPAVKAGWRNMPQVFSIPVKGDSMEPTLASGSYVFVDTTHVVPQPEDIYACDFGDGLSIKRLQLVPRSDKIRVMSDNARYEDYELRRDEVRVYGRVVAWFQWRG